MQIRKVGYRGEFYFMAIVTLNILTDFKDAALG